MLCCVLYVCAIFSYVLVGFGGALVSAVSTPGSEFNLTSIGDYYSVAFGEYFVWNQFSSAR